MRTLINRGPHTDHCRRLRVIVKPHTDQFLQTLVQGPRPTAIFGGSNIAYPPGEWR
jgi:hypothetical protein